MTIPEPIESDAFLACPWDGERGLLRIYHARDAQGMSPTKGQLLPCADVQCCLCGASQTYIGKPGESLDHAAAQAAALWQKRAPAAPVVGDYVRSQVRARLHWNITEGADEITDWIFGLIDATAPVVAEKPSLHEQGNRWHRFDRCGDVRSGLEWIIGCDTTSPRVLRIVQEALTALSPVGAKYWKQRADAAEAITAASKETALRWKKIADTMGENVHGERAKSASMAKEVAERRNEADTLRRRSELLDEGLRKALAEIARLKRWGIDNPTAQPQCMKDLAEERDVMRAALNAAAETLSALAGYQGKEQNLEDFDELCRFSDMAAKGAGAALQALAPQEGSSG